MPGVNATTSQKTIYLNSGNIMRIQVKRLSPHQNGKVFGAVMAVTSLFFLLPMFAMMSFSMPQIDQHGNPVNFPTFMILLMPLAYLIFGYISVAIGCLIYNFIVKYIGGIEFDVEGDNA